MAALQHVLHHCQHRAPDRFDALQWVPLARLQAASGVVAHQLGKAQHCVQGRAKFMTHAREKVVLGSIGLFQRQLVVRQRLSLTTCGDIDVDACHQHRSPVLVTLDLAERRQPMLAAVGPAHGELHAFGAGPVRADAVPAD